MRIVDTPLRAIMIDETSGTEKFEAKHQEPDLDDRERMTERALAAIRQTGPAAALEKCRALADQINAELLERKKIAPFALAELQANLARANVVIKNCAAPKNVTLGQDEAFVISNRSPLKLVLSAFFRRVPAFLRKN
jgi:hypothetical protein